MELSIQRPDEGLAWGELRGIIALCSLCGPRRDLADHTETGARAVMTWVKFTSGGALGGYGGHYAERVSAM